uniref:Ig-like domain-containing protein n=1 Tax=Sphaeramia orbicularis TaxID=375764 RepID=A0A673CZH6_9TELE
MAWIQFLVCLWTLFITQTVCSNSEYFEKEEGDSVVFPCAVNQSEPPPYGFALARRWLQTSTVLYKHKHTNHEVLISDYKNRISVSGDPTSYSVTVTISELRASDTDRYHCQFEVDNPFSDDIRKPGNTEFFLLVRADGPCECTSYSALIYALSSSVAVLFILLLVLVIIHRGKRRRAVKSPPQAPIYEEMSMVQPPSRKLAPCQLAEMESEYRNCSVKKSCPENHYESPRGPPGPRDE